MAAVINYIIVFESGNEWGSEEREKDRDRWGKYSNILCRWLI